jgi:4-hydroxy-4-methyl-2-oxoglutarate aldolase
MLDENPVLTINKNFNRPSAEAIAAFEGVPTGFLVDCMAGKGAIDYKIKPILPGRAKFAGVALTCDCGPGDNLALAAGLTLVQPGDVMLAATEGYTLSAVAGDLVVGMARNNGAVAVVTDGLVRDIDGIRDVDLPVFALGLTPNSPNRSGPGSVGLPMILGGVPVSSGDIVVGDEDGVVIVPHNRIADVLSRLPAVKKSEASMTANVMQEGQKVPGYLEPILRDKTIEIP